jgi:site-specific recombinase
MARRLEPHASGEPMPEGNGISREARESQSTVTLLRRLMNELATLVRQEIALATAEITRSGKTLLASATSVAIGGAVLYAGLLALLAAAILGLAHVMEPWLAALIVGVAVGIIGFVLVQRGVKAMNPEQLKPTQTAESLRRDKEILKRNTP